MTGSRSLAALVLGLSSIYLYSSESPLRSFGQVIVDKSRLVHWQDSAPKNNDCIVDQIANACEDVKIHFASNTAFLACGDPLERTKWYPGALRHDAAGRSEASFRENLFKYDIKTRKTTELRVDGLEGDFVTHGMDIFEAPGDASKIYIQAVRHARGDDAISIFSHTLGTDFVTLVKDVQHPAIYNPNGVAAMGPFEFYMTNDHYFVSGPLRHLEERFGPWTWTTNVVYCDASQEKPHCREVAQNFVVANGIATVDGKVFVGDSQNATVSIYDIQPDKGLKFDKRVDLGAAADNINVVPTTGDLVVAVFPTIENLPFYLDNTPKLGRELFIPAAALRLVKASGYEPELLYRDSGKAISFMTTMAVDPYNSLAIGAGVLQYGAFAVCRLDEETANALK